MNCTREFKNRKCPKKRITCKNYKCKRQFVVAQNTAFYG